MAKYPQEVPKMLATLFAHDDVRRVTFYGSPAFTIKITRMAKPDKREKAEHFILSMGRPNYAEKKFIKDCQKAGEPFPVRRVQLTRWPVKRGVTEGKAARLARKAKAGRKLTHKEIRSLSAAALPRR